MKTSWGISLLSCALGLVLLLSGSLFAQQAAVDVSSSWRGGHYKLSQNGDVVTSEGDFGHADGHFTGAYTFTMSWASATWNATVSADGNRIDWNNNSTWFRDEKSQDILAQKTGALTAQPATNPGETAGLAALNPSQPPATQQAASSRSLPGSTWAGPQTPGTKSPSAHGSVSGNSRSTLHSRAGRQPRPSGPNPVLWLDLATSLAQGKSSHELAAEVTAHGTDNYFDDGIAESLRLLGATGELINALRSARFFVDYDFARWKSDAIRNEAAVRSLLSKRPNDAGLHWLLAETLLIEEKLADAIPEARKAIELKPDLVCAHLTLSELLIDSGQNQEGLSEAKEAVRLMPNVVGPHLDLGKALLKNGDLPGAVAESREAVRIAPDFWWTHFELGTALYAKPDYEAAVFEFEEVSRGVPSFPSVHTWLAATLFYLGRYDEAAAEARTALLYDPKQDTAKRVLTSAKTKLSQTAGAGAANTQQPAAPTLAVSSNLLAGSTWTCQLVETDEYGHGGNWSLSATFLENGTAKVMNTEAGILFFDDFPNWQLNGATVSILTNRDHNGDDFVGTMNGQTSMTLRAVAHPDTSAGGSGTLTCNRQTPVPPSQPATQAQSSSNHPPYDDKCLRTGQGNLGSVTITNICTQPIDLKFCYRKQGDSGPWTCAVTPRLEPNHTLQSPFCEQCSYDGRAAAYLSSRNLLAQLPSDAEVASWSGSTAPQSASNAGGSPGSSDGQRQWRFVNPAQNWDTLSFEIRGRNGDSTSDDWNDEASLQTVTLTPGQSFTQDCGGYFSLDIKWQLASASDPQVDTFYASLVCYANNFVWNNNHNLREYDFPRQ